MSRRHHGGRPHRPVAHPRAFEPHRGEPVAPSPAVETAPIASADVGLEPVVVEAAPMPSAVNGSLPNDSVNGHVPGAFDAPPAGRANGAREPDAPAGCTAPQLRRFIKSRPYVPMHELRRRFGINGSEDDVTVVDVGPERIYIGLPHREGALLGELLRGGEIGYELSLDPRTPVVIGLYPMRPVARV